MAKARRSLATFSTISVIGALILGSPGMVASQVQAPKGGAPTAAGGAAAARIPIPAFELGPEEVVFDYGKDRCNEYDAPDSIIHAFRDIDGKVNLIATNHSGYRMIGDTLDTVKRDCKNVILKSGKKENFNDFMFFEWLNGTYTLDGQTVYALVHNEWYAYLAEPERCRKVPGVRSPFDGWVEALTFVVSTDKGATYSHPDDYKVLVPPVEWKTGPNGFSCDAKDKTHYGTGSAGNIIKKDDYYYTMVKSNRDPSNTIREGSCLLRTKDITQAAPWEAWTGAGWDTSTTAICAPIIRIGGMRNSLTYNTYLQAYILVGQMIGSKGYGVYFSLSKDLFNWTTPVNIAEPLNYASLLDPTDTSRNFENTGKSPYLYYSRKNVGMDRDLLRRKLTFTLP